ncbi:MAG: hypothetical protein LBF22_11930 [Deltaproteobacteria bacterium]|jgi:hypothetical protein|nr:hypothetical protein [Deltaproteobacteria bacterium]
MSNNTKKPGSKKGKVNKQDYIAQPKDKLGKICFNIRYLDPIQLLVTLEMTSAIEIPIENIELKETGNELYPNMMPLSRVDLLYKFDTNDKTNDKTNDNTNDKKNDKTNDKTNDNTNDKTNDNTNDKKKDEQNEIVTNYLLIEFEEKYDKETIRKHFRYINDLIAKYEKQHSKLFIYFVAIFGPDVNPNLRNLFLIIMPDFLMEGFFLKEVDVEQFLRDIEKKINSHEKLYSLELFILARLPELSKPFSQDLLRQVVDFFLHKDIIYEEDKGRILMVIAQLNNNKLPLEMWKEYWSNITMKTYRNKTMSKELAKAVAEAVIEPRDVLFQLAKREAKQEAKQETQEKLTKAAISLLNAKVPCTTIIHALDVTEEWLNDVIEKQKK